MEDHDPVPKSSQTDSWARGRVAVKIRADQERSMSRVSAGVNVAFPPSTIGTDEDFLKPSGAAPETAQDFIRPSGGAGTTLLGKSQSEKNHTTVVKVTKDNAKTIQSVCTFKGLPRGNFPNLLPYNVIFFL